MENSTTKTRKIKIFTNDGDYWTRGTLTNLIRRHWGKRARLLDYDVVIPGGNMGTVFKWLPDYNAWSNQNVIVKEVTIDGEPLSVGEVYGLLDQEREAEELEELLWG